MTLYTIIRRCDDGSREVMGTYEDEGDARMVLEDLQRDRVSSYYMLERSYK